MWPGCHSKEFVFSASVYVVPFLTLGIGIACGLLSLLVAKAKRVVRQELEGVSLEAQRRFRQALTRFVCGVSLLSTAMLGAASYSSIETAMGRVNGLHAYFYVLSIGMPVFCIVGIIYLAVRYGQGGSRLERRVSNASLSAALADNTKWKLGLIYVNREDPSIFVEHRFGLGHALNFGNPKAVAVLAAFLILTSGTAATALLAK